jgi:hypothetical protein
VNNVALNLQLVRLPPSSHGSSWQRDSAGSAAYPFETNGFGAFPARIAGHRFIAAALSFAL